MQICWGICQWWRGFLFLPVVTRFLLQNLIHLGRSNVAQHSQFLNGAMYRYKYCFIFSVDNEIWQNIIMMCYNSKHWSIVFAISMKSVVLFPNAEFIPDPKIYFKTEMGQIKISMYFVCLKFRPPARYVVILLAHSWALYKYLLSGKDTKGFHLKVCVCDMHRYDAFLMEKLLMELWGWTFFSRRIKVHRI